MKDIYESLIAAYRDKVASLVALQDALNTELAQIRNENKVSTLKARLKSFARKREDAEGKPDAFLVASIDADVESTLTEIEQIETRVDEITRVLETISSQKKAAANSNLNQHYPQIAAESCQDWAQIVERTEARSDALKRYADETGANLTSRFHDYLVPQDHGEMRDIYRRLHQWV